MYELVLLHHIIKFNQERFCKECIFIVKENFNESNTIQVDLTVTQLLIMVNEIIIFQALLSKFHSAVIYFE